MDPETVAITISVDGATLDELTQAANNEAARFSARRPFSAVLKGDPWQVGMTTGLYRAWFSVEVREA